VGVGDEAGEAVNDGVTVLVTLTVGAGVFVAVFVSVGVGDEHMVILFSRY
jgi:hypothetical protein